MNILIELVHIYSCASILLYNTNADLSSLNFSLLSLLSLPCLYQVMNMLIKHVEPLLMKHQVYPSIQQYNHTTTPHDT